MIDFVKHPVLTEKSTRLIENDQYTFDVDKQLNKLQIKSLMESLFQVKVIAVNTHCLPPKKGRFGKVRNAKYKRAIITLKKGQSIPLFPNTDSIENL